MEGKTEFAVFCIENIARQLHTDAALVYKALTKKSRVLYDYILPNYDVLHTQGKDYIVNDILERMDELGITV